VGNESHVGPARYRFSRRYYRSVREYAFGGERHINDEALGKGFNHPGAGVPSNGHKSQTYSVLYPPLRRARLRST
jgi:hypothetical protein